MTQASIAELVESWQLRYLRMGRRPPGFVEANLVADCWGSAK